MTHTPKKENLEEEIFKLLHKKHMGENCSKQIEYLKSFVDGLLTAQLQSILEEMEEMKKNKRADFGRETSWEIENKNGYYEAINDVQSIISNRMEK